MINQTMSAKDWAMLLMLSFLWGGSFFFIGVAVTELPPLTIVTLRVGLAAIILWIFFLVSGQEVPKSFSLWRTFFVLGLLGNAIPFHLSYGDKLILPQVLHQSSMQQLHYLQF